MHQKMFEYWLFKIQKKKSHIWLHTTKETPHCKKQLVTISEEYIVVQNRACRIFFNIKLLFTKLCKMLEMGWKTIFLSGIIFPSITLRNLGVTFGQDMSFSVHNKQICRISFFHLCDSDSEKLVCACVTLRLNLIHCYQVV